MSADITTQEQKLIDELADEWYASHQAMVLLTSYMADCGEFDARDIAYAVEKPWKFALAYVRAVKEQEEEL